MFNVENACATGAPALSPWRSITSAPKHGRHSRSPPASRKMHIDDPERSMARCSTPPTTSPIPRHWHPRTLKDLGGDLDEPGPISVDARSSWTSTQPWPATTCASTGRPRSRSPRSRPRTTRTPSANPRAHYRKPMTVEAGAGGAPALPSPDGPDVRPADRRRRGGRCSATTPGSSPPRLRAAGPSARCRRRYGHRP